MQVKTLLLSIESTRFFLFVAFPKLIGDRIKRFHTLVRQPASLHGRTCPQTLHLKLDALLHSGTSQRPPYVAYDVKGLSHPSFACDATVRCFVDIRHRTGASVCSLHVKFVSAFNVDHITQYTVPTMAIEMALVTRACTLHSPFIPQLLSSLVI